jgi:trehalose synthase-fused probable maltokinase
VVRADLVADATALLRPEWLTAQRWYGANDRQLVSLELTDAAALPGLGEAVAPARLLVAEAVFSDGGAMRYIVPAIPDPVSGLHEPADGDGTWRSLAGAILSGSTLAGDGGTFRCEPSPDADALVPDGEAWLAGTTEQRLGVEQSNTSVTLGDRLMLKLYRRLQPGENPELEVGAFLESVGCEVTPRMAGAMRYFAADGSSSAAAMLQERVAAHGDAWAQITSRLAAGQDMSAAVDRIGSVTASLHTSFAARPQDLAFPVRPATAEEIDSWRELALRQLEGALEALRGEEREKLQDLVPRLRARMMDAFASAGPVRVMRIHGDYHLGQLLVTNDGYVVIDFEGEPARPLTERRAPQPPERDVAGMLRSLDYAARTVARENAAFKAETWLAGARDKFLSAYRRSAPAPPNPGLLSAFEVEKACYEVRYEAANRPDWTWLPIEALMRLA